MYIIISARKKAEQCIYPDLSPVIVKQRNFIVPVMHNVIIGQKVGRIIMIAGKHLQKIFFINPEHVIHDAAVIIKFKGISQMPFSIIIGVNDAEENPCNHFCKKRCKQPLRFDARQLKKFPPEYDETKKK